ncbi:TMEM175 family protein [Terricaulis silvestris]|uniref:Integral membrane protein n=1 Tax=Terricaulis silvestris TaxID=2686094 RepID=A0A6I6MNR9_9CAUL|nr:TMEM175 family protein [Terricaulis silvestris]QGZ95771.1 hypothetical protein DSM104635_02622 [Terricaulis silvestris]
MSHHESAAQGPDARMVDRMLFFSDAVFAIVLTLLAIELHAPEIHESGLWPALAAMGAQFFAFGLSFALIGLWWLIHMRVMRKLTHFDWPTAICNLLLLASITLLPFASAVFGENFADMDALQFYWWVSAATASSMTLTFLVAARDGGRLIGGISMGEWLFRLTQSLAPVIAFLAGVYFCATDQVWPARFAAFIMFPIMMLGRVFYRAPKPVKA